MTTDQRVLAILGEQERERETGKKIAGIVAIIVILPVVALVVWAMITIGTA